LFGLDPSVYGKTFKNINGEEFKVVGLKPKAPKYPLLATRNGNRYKFKLSDMIRKQIEG